MLPSLEAEVAAPEWPERAEERLEQLRAQLDGLVRTTHGGTAVLRVVVEWKMSIYGYTTDRRPLLRVEFADPRDVARLRESPGLGQLGRSYESNVPFVSRFQIDHGMGGATWISVPRAAARLRPAPVETHCQLELDVLADQVTYHLAVDRGGLAPMRRMTFDIEMAPGRVGAFPDANRLEDEICTIGCNLTLFPSHAIAKRVVLALKACDPLDDPHSVVLSFATERDLLLHFALLVRAFDPDWLLGYNSINFDMRVILQRMQRLDMHRDARCRIDPTGLSRKRGLACRTRIEEFESGAIGKMKYHIATMPGRLQYDIMLLVRRDIACSYSSYSLDAVTREMKVQLKGSMPYAAIPVLQRGALSTDMPAAETTADWLELARVLRPRLEQGANRKLVWENPTGATPQTFRDSDARMQQLAHGGEEAQMPEEIVGAAWKMVHRFNVPVARGDAVMWAATAAGRAAIADYCLDDSICADAIERRRTYLMNHIEIARLCFIGLMPLLTRGQQVRVMSVILRYLRATDFVVPYHRPAPVLDSDRSKRTKGYKGATVIAPYARFFFGVEDGMIIFVDFAGLYPSIIIAFNLCYSTHMPQARVEEEQAKGTKLRQAPNGEWFVDASVRRGILPSILEGVIAARSAAKKGIYTAQMHVKELRAVEALIKADDSTRAASRATAMAAALFHLPRELHPAKGEPMNNECASRASARVDEVLAAVGGTAQGVAAALAMVETLVAEWTIANQSADAKQMALKVVANSVYGFTGAQRGKMPCQEVSSAVTAYGRMMINKVMEMLEARVTAADGTERYGVDPDSPDAEARAGLSKYLLRVVYGDTDSNAVHAVGCTSVMEAWALGKRLAQMCTDYFQRLAGNNAIVLELEKICALMVLFGKKRYFKLQWEKNGAGVMECKIDAKGYEAKRRDNPPVVRRTLQMCGDILFPTSRELVVDSPEASRKPDVERAVQLVKDTLQRMLRGQVPLADYIVTKSYNRDLSQYAKTPPAHIQAFAEQVRAGKIELGQRIPYVHVQSRDGTGSTASGIADPARVVREGLSIDVHHYIENCMKKPFARFFAQFFDRRGTLNLPRAEYDRRMFEIRGPDPNDGPACKAIEKRRRTFLEARALRILFTGPHMNVVVCPRVAPGSIFSRFVRDVRGEVRAQLVTHGITVEHFRAFYRLRSAAAVDDWLAGGAATPAITSAAQMFVQGFVPIMPGPTALFSRRLACSGETVEQFCTERGLRVDDVERWLDGYHTAQTLATTLESYATGSQ